MRRVQSNAHQLESCLSAPTTQCIPAGHLSVQAPELQSLTEQTPLLAGYELPQQPVQHLAEAMQPAQ
jgi:hypothetical protein